MEKLDIRAASTAPAVVTAIRVTRCPCRLSWFRDSRRADPGDRRAAELGAPDPQHPCRDRAPAKAGPTRRLPDGAQGHDLGFLVPAGRQPHRRVPRGGRARSWLASTRRCSSLFSTGPTSSSWLTWTRSAPSGSPPRSVAGSRRTQRLWARPCLPFLAPRRRTGIAIVEMRKLTPRTVTLSRRAGAAARQEPGVAVGPRRARSPPRT